MIDQIATHQQDLLRALAEVKDKLSKENTPRLHPARFAKFLYAKAKMQACDPRDRFTCSHAIRQVHDFYGWKAKGFGPRGCCAGALYRSENYLKLALSCRNGTKTPNRSVHIEHTVPVATLHRAIRAQAQSINSVVELHNFLLVHSVCTAVTKAEESLVHAAVERSNNDSFDILGKKVHEYPFRRYLPIACEPHNFRVFNVPMGNWVNLREFTYDDHQRTLLKASERWLFGNIFFFVEAINLFGIAMTPLFLLSVFLGFLLSFGRCGNCCPRTSRSSCDYIA